MWYLIQKKKKKKMFYDGDTEPNCPVSGIRFLANAATAHNLKPGRQLN